ncbi:MAG: metallophosphoesterase [Spirochaetaceae bacterium]|jgi:hypothetical protein|nr:metallophosphoesterase [Spirochaetaceae bacterium]
MKLLCVSDEIDPQIYSSSIKERFSDVDLILSAGDVPLDYLEFISSSLNRPLLFVFGNHCLGDYAAYQSAGAQSLALNITSYFESEPIAPSMYAGGKVVKESGLLIAGLGGSMRYSRGANQWTNTAMRLRIFKLIPRLVYNKICYGRCLDILLTHAPPEGIHDKDDPCHRGFKDFLWFMRIFKPRYLIHGHIHVYDADTVRRTDYFGTTVINVYNHQIVEIQDR